MVLEIVYNYSEILYGDYTFIKKTNLIDTKIFEHITNQNQYSLEFLLARSIKFGLSFIDLLTISTHASRP